MRQSTESQNVFKPERFSVPIIGGEIAGWRCVNPDAPPLLFCHATGFCASAYEQMLVRLSDHFDVYAIDMRGHGRTRLPANPEQMRSWSVYAADVSSFLDSQRRNGWVLAGHSMGAVASVMAARGRDDIAALALVEPVSLPPLLNLFARTPAWAYFKRHIPPFQLALRRRAVWPDRDASLASYARKALFQSWAPGVLADYLKDGLIEDGESVRLSCAPSWEAATFAAHANDMWGAVAAAPAPIAVLAANHRSSTLIGRAKARFTRHGAQIHILQGATHLAPLEQPDAVAGLIVQTAS